MRNIVMGVAMVACLGLLAACTGTGKGSSERFQKLGEKVAEAELITPQELKAMLSEKGLVVLDMRNSRDWEESGKKIPSASRIGNTDIDSWAQDVDKDRKIVVYCA